MIRSFVGTLLASIAVYFAVLSPLHAQVHLYDSEPLETQREFIRNLRSRGYLALTKEFTDELIAKVAKTDKEAVAILQLENARTGVEMAKDQKPELRLAMIDKARAAFEPFIKANPNSYPGAEARAEMARVYSMQALMRLNKAMAGEPGETREKGAADARRLYDAADAEYVNAIKSLQAIKKDTTHVDFDRANNLLSKADAFINLEDSTQNRQRAQTVGDAIKIFAVIAKDKETVNGLLANAYLVKCYQEGQDPPKIAEHLKIVFDATGPKALPAQKLAYYYDILYVRTVPDFKGDREKKLFDGANDWLKTYPADRKSYQGEHLRFEQAVILLRPALTMSEVFNREKLQKIAADPKQKAALEQSLVAAEKVLLELDKEGGDFSERAAYYDEQIKRARISYTLDTKGDDYDTAIIRVNEAIRKAVKLLDGTDKAAALKAFQDVHTLIANAVRVGEKANVTPSKLHEAQFLLGQAYDAVNDLQRSAIAFEMLARANPPSKKASEAAVQAIQIYSRFADEGKDESARFYLRELGTFVLEPSRQKLWAGEPVVGITRYFLAKDYLFDEKFKEALEHYDNIPKDFPGYIYAQGESVLCALRARDKAREKEDAAEEEKMWIGEARKGIARMGQLPAAADGSTTLLWFIASCEGPKFLYAEATELLKASRDLEAEKKSAESAKKEAEADKKYAEMGASIATLRSEFAKHSSKIAEERRKQIGFTIDVLEKYKDLGAADVLYKKGKYDLILKDDVLGAVAKEILKIGETPGPIKVKDVGIVGDSLSLVLRSFVQLGNLKAAEGVYGLLTRLAAEDGDGSRNARFTRLLIEDLKQQVKVVKDANDAAKLKEIRGKFVPFADVLAKSLITDKRAVEKKDPEIGDVNNMVQFYMSLDEYKKAADLIKSIPEPKHLNAKGIKNEPAKFDKKQEDELEIYWYFQIENGKLLRLSKDFKGANTALSNVMNHPNARRQTMAEFELIEMYIDMEQYGTSIKLVGGLMDKLRRADPGKNENVKKLYFQGFYKNTYSLYKYSQTDKVKKDGKDVKYLALAASQIVNLENAQSRDGWQIVGPQFQELMEHERPLRDAYEAAKKKTK